MQVFQKCLYLFHEPSCKTHTLVASLFYRDNATASSTHSVRYHHFTLRSRHCLQLSLKQFCIPGLHLNTVPLHVYALESYILLIFTPSHLLLWYILFRKSLLEEHHNFINYSLFSQAIIINICIIRWWVHVESTLHKPFISPGCWWGYGKHLLESFQLL